LGLKWVTTAQPTTQHCGRELGRGLFLYSPEDFLYKIMYYTHIIIKSSLCFYGKPLKQKSLLGYFARYLWFLKNILLCHPGLISIFV
jgi:hypothetical protein